MFKSLWLTTNADTIYVVGALDLTKGPMVLATAPGGSRRHPFTKAWRPSEIELVR